MFVNVADLVDQKDPQRRTRREINRARKHSIQIGALVELESGVRLFVAEHGRDCDQTPLYSLSPVNPVIEPEPNALIFRSRLMGGYGEESLKIIKI